MLGKLVWKILRKESTIWLKLIHARYLKNRNLLNYMARPGDSSAWKGIVRIAQLLKSCFVWKIGSGSSMSFWFDTWMGKQSLCELVENILPEDRALTVADVLHDGDGILPLFIPHSLLTLSRKSYSFCICRIKQRTLLSGSRHLQTRTGSRTICKGLISHPSSNQKRAGPNCLQPLFGSYGKRVTLLYSGERDEPPDKSIFLIKQYSTDLASRFSGKILTRQTWSRPPLLWHKLNIDGSFHSDSSQGAVGGLLRDDKGCWKWGFSRCSTGSSVDELEALALATGLEHAWNNRIPMIEIEIDSLMVFEWVKATRRPEHLQNIITKCRTILHKPWQAKILKIHRSANTCTNLLAKHGYSVQMGMEFMDSPHVYLLDALEADRLGSI